MSFKDKLKDAILSRSAEGLAVAASIIIIWAATQISPVIMPAIKTLSKEIIVSLMLASFALNIIIVICFAVLQRRPEFKLKYGIYWDKEKNPHCPICKIPIGRYGKYGSGKGYYCNSCNKVFRLTDVSGDNIEPQTVIKEL